MTFSRERATKCEDRCWTGSIAASAQASMVDDMVAPSAFGRVAIFSRFEPRDRHDEAKAVVAKMRDMPIHDFFADHGQLRVDGRMGHDMYLVEVKKPEESRYPWDYYKIVQTIPGEEAFRPIGDSDCPLLAKR